MILNDIIQHNGKHYIRVTPAKWMMNSNLIYDNIMAGHQFVVEMATGQLTKLHGGEVVVECPAQVLPFNDKKQAELF